MQEDAGGVENVAVGSVESETSEKQNVAENVAPKKKSRPKKKAQIPTVEAIVSQEDGPVEENVPVDGRTAVEEQAAVETQTTVEAQASAEEQKAVEEQTDEEALEQSEIERIESKRAELNLDSETALLETVLFLESEPQSPESLSKITHLDLDTISSCVERLKEKYSDMDSGIELSQIVGGWILTPKKECFDLVKERYGKRNEGRLSKAAIETLSIIAYSQPITRAEIESIRHVSADNMMRILLDRKFIKEVGKKDIPGKPVMYGTTNEFLEFFHLQSIADLPQLDEKESERFELAR
ncbi:MAG: SMC-Scp complex subunit ScpB [Treponema sp.]|nr:SMC-Scp complex subunit ScpB [Treponema sp.]